MYKSLLIFLYSICWEILYDVIFCNGLSVGISCGVDRSKSICVSALVLVDKSIMKQNCFQQFAISQYHDKKKSTWFYFRSCTKSSGKYNFLVRNSQDIKKQLFLNKMTSIKIFTKAVLLKLHSFTEFCRTSNSISKSRRTAFCWCVWNKWVQTYVSEA